MHVLVPQGIGDSVWSLFKAQGIADRYGDGQVEIRIAHWASNEIETRSLEFIRRFDFVRSAEMYAMPLDGRRGPVHPKDGAWVDDRGRHIYIPSGPTKDYDGIDYVAIANGHLERGLKLEDWLPEIPMDWSVPDRFRFADAELTAAVALAEEGDYATIYFGPKGGNTHCGHNRGGLWSPDDWRDVVTGLVDRGLRCVVIGASYDRPYFDEFIEPLNLPLSENFIGCHGIGQTMAILRRASLCVSYQSGIGIMSSYFGVPTCLFWRPDGDTIIPGAQVSFDERMATAWARPQDIASGRHFGAIYGRHGPADVLAWSRRWPR